MVHPSSGLGLESKQLDFSDVHALVVRRRSVLLGNGVWPSSYFLSLLLKCTGTDVADKESQMVDR